MNMMGNSKSREVLTSKEVILPKQDQSYFYIFTC